MNTTLAFTISPPNRIKGVKLRNFNRVLYDEDSSIIKSIFKYNRIKRYIFYPEFDDKGRLHYHGIIDVDYNQKVRFYKHAQAKLSSIGFIDFKPMNSFQDKLKWIIYMKKHWGFTKQVLELDKPIEVLTK